MANSLRLILARHTNRRAGANALSMPLERGLGDLPYLMYVYADSLPLALGRKVSERSSANTLYISLSQPLGTYVPIVYVSADALPLPVNVAISKRAASSMLALPLSRKLGTVNGNVIPPPVIPEPEPPPVDPEEPTNPTDPTDPVDPEEPVDPEVPLEYAPPLTALSSCISSVITGVSTINHCRAWHHDGHHIANDRAVMRTDVINIAQRYSMQMRGLIPIANDTFTLTSQVYELACDARISYIAFIHIDSERDFKHSSTIGYTRCVNTHSAKVAHYRNCATLPLTPAVNFATSTGHKVHGVSIDKCQRSKIQHAVQVPDRYYPIPEPSPDKPDNVCRIRPPSSELPLRMARKRNELLPSNLPLSLTCWHDDPPPTIPNLRSYIVHNVISATIGGIAVDILSFGIKTDMDSYCWQGDITITAKDYAKIKAKLDVPRGSEPMINVTINGFVFAFIAEEQSRSRKFAQNSHSLSGRSITARLGADYAGSQGGLIEQASFVSQIVAQQLNGLSVSVLDWDINDWLVPARTYSAANKTPIAVISDIAAAGGGFVVSDPSQATLSVRPRWPVSAWQLASATPDMIVPIDVIVDISDKKRTNPRYNTVLLTGSSEGGEVYRQTQGQDAEAPTQDHALYTDRDAIVPAGTAILSDSGTHGDYTLKMRWADKYSIQLAELGQVWQINDPEGAWRGVTTGVSVNIDQDNDAPTAWQTVTIDRYLDA
ncbi:hypothetical protein ACTXGO_00785 [Psychrobacter sp. T6-1]|uniref:hypothetical protein n=1 Tax=Psychrobacter sp. T6-1 TaxID=3457447 RepID=UPI003FD611A2